MGMSTHGMLFVEIKYGEKEMLELRDLLDKHKMAYPKELQHFLDNSADLEITEDGMIEFMDGGEYFDSFCDDDTDGLELDIDSLPAGVKRIRVYNSY